MIRINQLKLGVTQEEHLLEQKIQKALRLFPNQEFEYSIVKKSIDARKKDQLLYIYSVNVYLTKKEEAAILARIKDPNVIELTEILYEFPKTRVNPENKIVIAGSGPAGLFCGLFLARAGYSPVIFERGHDVDTRTKMVDDFWRTSILDPNTNVQFGEGGAGTFSDGKLNSVVKEKSGRIHKVLETFVEFGAPAEILYQNKPHIGTDILSRVVKNIRQEIIRLGGSVQFQSQVTNLFFEKNQLKAVEINHQEQVECHALVLAIGHSARDTFTMLLDHQIAMETKAFAVGLRVEHSQSLINTYAYGAPDPMGLPVADYKVTANTKDKRGVYSFCMCPGGYVVNASSEEGMLCVNGMSYSRRDGKNANSAIIVTINPADFPSDHILGGMELQRQLEKAAFLEGKGAVPCQLNEDFQKGIASTGFGSVTPQIKGAYQPANLRNMLPEYLSEAIIEGMQQFNRSIPGFNRPDAVFAGVESRTSSPVRILRGEHQNSISHSNIFPCGEGAGYAGGITSAAVDGIKTAEALASYFV